MLRDIPSAAVMVIDTLRIAFLQIGLHGMAAVSPVAAAIEPAHEARGQKKRSCIQWSHGVIDKSERMKRFFHRLPFSIPNQYCVETNTKLSFCCPFDVISSFWTC